MISIKRAATIGATAAILLGTAMPAFAGQRYNRSNDELDVNQHNSAVIINDVDTKADTGDNSVGGGMNFVRSLFHGGSSGGGRIVTGDALADALVQTTANENSATVDVRCGCFDDVDVHQGNHAFVLNDVETKADTGDNSVSGGSKWGRGSVIRTGDATAVGTVQTLVNRNVAVVN